MYWVRVTARSQYRALYAQGEGFSGITVDSSFIVYAQG